MCDEWTRENQISEMSLNIKLSAVYLTAVSIASGLLIFIIGSSAYSDLAKIILIPFLALVLFIILRQYHQKKGEIKKIFHDITNEDIIPKQGNKTELDSQTLNNLIIIMCGLLFLIFCWVVIALIQFNTDVSSYLIKGNLSEIDIRQGNGLLSLFNPFIGIFSALALFCLDLIVNIRSNSKIDKQMMEMNENIKEIKNKLP